MKRLALSLAATLPLLCAISCSGVTGGLKPNPDGGGPATPPLACASDTICGSTRACIGNICVDRQPDLGTWAIEIDPPRGSGAQLTELPTVGVVNPVLTPSPEIKLAVSFDNTGKPGVTIPTSAGVILSVPSTIPGRLAPSFQTNLTPDGRAELAVPGVLSGGDVLFTLIPQSPSDLESPPYALPFMLPADATAFAVPLPAGPFTVRGLLRDSLDQPKTQYAARVFERSVRVTSIPDRDVLVSSIGKTTTDGVFTVILPGGARNDLTLELVPETVSDPVVTLSGLSLAGQNTDLGVMTLPAYAMPRPFRVTVHGDDGTPVDAATVRAHTTFAGAGGAGGTNPVVTGAGGAGGGIIGGTGTAGTSGIGGGIIGGTGTAGTSGIGGRGGSGTVTDGPRVTTRFFRDTLTDAGGVANLSLIPGTTLQQPYTLSVVPPAGSPWASQCVTDVPVGFNGPGAPTAVARDVTLAPRLRRGGSVVSHSGTPVAGVVVTATGTAAGAPPCLAGPATTNTTTDAMGRFELLLDSGDYKLEFVPPAGSPFPRLTVPTTPVRYDEMMPIRLPEPAVVEGRVITGGVPVANATIRIFQPRCEQVDPCTTPPLLHAEAQTDADGRFRAIIPKPDAIATN
jgi:hypothetical protein